MTAWILIAMHPSEAGALYFLSRTDAFGSESTTELADALRFSSPELAEETLHQVLDRDDRYYPPIDPVVARVDDERVTVLSLALTDEGEAMVRAFAQQYDLQCEAS